MKNTQSLLWIGKSHELTKQVKKHLFETFCPNKGQDCFCNECEKISKQQHPNIVWVNPLKNYYVSYDIDVIFEKIAFSLGDEEKFYFILNQAETLGHICANKLLKVLEEPPRGYIFILLSENINAILPTIQSRCLKQSFYSHQSIDEVHPVLSYFLDRNKLEEPLNFELELKKQGLNDHESRRLINELFQIFGKKVVNCHKKNSFENIDMLNKSLEHIKNALKNSPQPGGSTLFWKNLYLSFPR